MAKHATAAALLTELIRHGIELAAHGDKLRYRPRSAMTPDLAERVKVLKPALLAILTANDAATSQYTTEERHRLAEADMMPATMPLLDAAKEAFPETEVIEARQDHYIANNPRRQPVIDLIWPIAQANPAHARDLADAWMERVAICEIDGGLSAEDAEAVAFNEVAAIVRRT